MKLKKTNIGIIIVVLFLLGIGLSAIKYYYKDVYMMSLNGRIDEIHVNIQGAMFVTIEKKEHNFAHFWPQFQIKAQVGDSVFKKSKDYNIVLIKKGTNQRILCKYEE